MEHATKVKTFGRRLKEARTALGLSQKEFGALGGVLANAQSKYEKGSRFLRADYLTAIASRGVDVLYLLTGKKSRFKEALSDEEAKVIENYRRLNQGNRNAIARLVSSLAEFSAPDNSHSTSARAESF